MCRQNLLAQGRARARHANNEDRRGIGVLRPRAVGEPILIEGGDVGIDQGAMFVTRKRLAALQQRMAGLPMRKCTGVRILRRPKFGEIAVPHDAVFENGFRPHRLKRGFHLLGRRPRAGHVIDGARQ
jgi:hypothetical protein